MPATRRPDAQAPGPRQVPRAGAALRSVPAPGHDRPGHDRPGHDPRSAREDGLAPRVRARRAITLLGLTVLAPGSAQLVAGSRRAGRLALRVWLTAVAVALVVGLLWLVHRSWALALATDATVLHVAGALLVLAGVGWPLLVLDAWRLGGVRRLPPRARRRIAATAATLTLLTCLLPIGAGTRVWAAGDLIGGVFGDGERSAAVDGRYTVLLLGGDAGPDRIGTRPDSVNLASIDEETGRTVLFSFPRNLQNIPFPAGSAAARALPDGWSCGDECLLNAVYQWGAEHPDLFPGAPDPGAEAMKQAVQGITGLHVNYYALIDLRGFRSLIDAVGGIDLTVQRRVPIGGGTSRVTGWIESGTQHLDGYHALWFARSRHGSSDYERMIRQRCVMTAMLDQLDPATVLGRFQDIAAAGRQVVSTDLPSGQLPTFLSLAPKARGTGVSSVQFSPPLIVPHHPDYPALRAKVREAITASERLDAEGAAAPTASGGSASGGSASGGSASGGSASGGSASGSSTATGKASPGARSGSAAKAAAAVPVCST